MTIEDNDFVVVVNILMKFGKSMKRAKPNITRAGFSVEALSYKSKGLQREKLTA
jgi:hypothetical protein